MGEVIDMNGLPWWLSGKESACQGTRRRSCRFNPRVRKISWRSTWQPTLAFLPAKFHGQRSLVGLYVHGVTKESDPTEKLSTIHHH